MKVNNPYEGELKEEYVHSIFNHIADKYDWMNTAMSLNRDKYWREFAVNKTNLKPGGFGLDVCCGTGMLSLEMAKKVGEKGKVIGIDFSENMLEKAKVNLAKHPLGDIVKLVNGNAMELPFADNTFDCATIGFALRNVPNIETVLKEMMRVVKPGGMVVSLELAKPTTPVFKQLFWFYFEKLVPLLGKLKVEAKDPYSYLPYSVRVFPSREEVKNIFSKIGLLEATYYDLTNGIVTVHVGAKGS